MAAVDEEARHSIISVSYYDNGVVNESSGRCANAIELCLARARNNRAARCGLRCPEAGYLQARDSVLQCMWSSGRKPSCATSDRSRAPTGSGGCSRASNTCVRDLRLSPSARTSSRRAALEKDAGGEMRRANVVAAVGVRSRSFRTKDIHPRRLLITYPRHWPMLHCSDKNSSAFVRTLSPSYRPQFLPRSATRRAAQHEHPINARLPNPAAVSIASEPGLSCRI